MEEPASGRRWGRLAAVLAGAVVFLAVAIAGIVHTPAVRGIVLRRVVAELESRVGLVLDADSLDYNLFQLRVSLANVRLAAAGAREEPFLEAARIDVDFPGSVLSGVFAIDSVVLDNLRIRIHTRADGTSNLPSVGEGGGGPPPAIPVASLRVARAALDVIDDANDFSLTLPAFGVDTGPADGRLQLLSPGRLRLGAVETPISALDGGLAFDGRTVHLTRLAVATGEASLTADGTLALLVADRRMDLRVNGTADVPGAARWGTDAVVPTGTIAFDGTVSGPFAQPSYAGRVQSAALAWQGFTASMLEGAVAVDLEQVSIDALSARIAGGEVSLAGTVRFASSDIALQGRWSDVDLSAVAGTLAPDLGTLPAGRLAGTATARGVGGDLVRWTITAENRTAPVAPVPGRIGIPGTTMLRVESGRWNLDADHVIAGTPVQAALAGALDADRFASSTLEGRLTVPTTELPALLSELRAAGLAAGDDDLITGGRLQAEATLSGTLGAPGIDMTAAAGDVAVSGMPPLDADAMATGTLERLEVDLDVRQGTANAIAAAGSLRVSERTFDARVTGQLADPAAFADGAPVGGLVTLDLDASGTFTAPTVAGTVTVAGARYGSIGLGRLDSTLEADTSAVRISATAAELAARVTAALTFDDARQTTIDLTLTDTDLGRLLQDAQPGSPVTGRVSLTASASGPATAWRRGTAAIQIASLDAQVRQLPVRLTSPASLRYDGAVLDLAPLDATAGDLRLHAEGRLPLADGGDPVPADRRLRAEVLGNLGEVLAAAATAGLVADADLSGSGTVTLLAQVGGSAARPILTANLELASGSLTSGTWPAASGVRLRAEATGGWLELREATAEWQGSLLTAEGRMPLQLAAPYLPAALATALEPVPGSASLTVRANGITPQVLAPFMDPGSVSQIEGSIDLSARLESPSLELEDVEGSITLDRLDIRMAGLPVAQRQPTSIVLAGGFARVTSWDWVGQGAELGVQGQVRLADRQAALIANGRVDLRMLTPFVRGTGLTLNGTLEPRLSVTGLLERPRLDGDLVLSQGELRLASPQVVATELSGRAILSGATVFVTALAGSVNGGTLAGDGEIALRVDGPASSLSVNLQGVALEFPEGLRSQIDADLTLALTPGSGARPAAGRLTGDVVVAEGAYRDPLVVVTTLLRTISTRRLTAAGAAGESFLDRLALDVRVVTDNDVVVDNNLARLQLDADVRVIGTGTAPSLSGRAELREGGQLFFGRNVYTIDTGTIDFANPTTIEPNLNIRARTRAGGEDIELALSGTPDALDVQLRSTSAPELDEADVASLLITGRPLSEVPSAQSQIVSEQVVGYLSGDVLGVAGRAFGLDTLRLGAADESLLRLDPTAIATETDPTSRLTIGRRIGDRFEVTLSQSLRENDSQTWIIDYLATRRLNFRFVQRDDNTRAYEFRHDVVFGAAPVGAAPTRDRAEPRVVAVTISGDPALPEARLRSEIGIEAGDRFDFGEWQRARDRLAAFYRREGYREARISERRIDGDGGVTLAFEVSAGPLTAILVNGYDLDRASLQAIDDAWVQSILDDFLVAEADAIVRRALADDGYLEPAVAVALEPGPPKAMRITVEPGQQARGRSIRIRVEDPALVSALDARVALGRFRETAFRDPAPLQADLQGYVQSLGYLRAEVAVAPPAVVDGTAVIDVAVTPGPLYRISDVRVEGASPRAPTAVFEIGHLDPGTPYAATPIDLEQQRLSAAYRSSGFTTARVVPRPTVIDATSQVEVAFVVEEGPQQVLRETLVQGNTGINEDVVLRALDLPLGQPLGGDAWLQARTRVFQTGLFERVDVAVETIDDRPATELEQPVRARVAVREWPAVRLRYGVRISEERPADELEGRNITPGLSADVTRRTLFRRAITIGGAGDYQKGYALGRVFAGTPTMLGWPIESLITVERSREDRARDTFVTDQSSVSWEQRVRVAGNLRLSYSYSFDRDHVFDTEPPLDPNLPVFDVTVNIARLSFAGVRDTRSDPADPVSGSLFVSDVEVAPKALGSEISFVRYSGLAYHFRPWRGLVFASAARLGLVKGLGDQEVIPSERFFSGGARSLRGVPEDSLGPRGFLETPLGGRALVLVNQEVRFPLYRWLRGVGFVDVGNVFGTPGDIRLKDFVGSAGAGLRLATPFALFRLDYAGLWTDVQAESGGRLTFGVGHAF